jgi:short-subunit dehydrogenase
MTELPSFSVTDQVALVTGASSGIGEATARRLAREPDARLVLVARREERLRGIADELGGATVIAEDLTDAGAAARVREVIDREHGELHMLVNNAGARWPGEFGDVGADSVTRHMQLNFEAPVRLTEALLPILRATACRPGGRRVSIVNVASTAARVARPGAAAYSASKFALAGWSDGLHAEERPHGVHVGMVLPGYVATEGFPAAELVAKAATRWLVSDPEVVAEAIMEAGPGGRAERYVPRYYWIFAALRILAPRVVRGAVAGGGFTPAAGSGE